MKKILLSVVTLFIVSFASAQPNTTMIDDAPYSYEEVEIKPQFPGGNDEFMRFVGSNFKINDYDGGGGTLKLIFIIEADGSITNIKIMKDLGQGTGAEAKRVIAMSPKWSPGENFGKKIRVLFELPIKIANHS